MSNIICCEQSECPVCSVSYFQYIYNLALHKEYDEIERVNIERKLYRKKVLEEKLNHLNVDLKHYHYTKVEEENFEDVLALYNINASQPYEKNIDILIELKDWSLLNYYYDKEIRMDDWSAKFCKTQTLKERDRRSKKFLKMFFKQNPQFKEASERKGCHVLLLFDPMDTKKYRLQLNKDDDEDLNDYIERYPHNIVFLINRNPHDGKLVSKSHIMKKVNKFFDS